MHKQMSFDLDPRHRFNDINLNAIFVSIGQIHRGYSSFCSEYEFFSLSEVKKIYIS